jgi:hypothetical protein
MFLFVRFVPMINIFEVKDLLHRYRHRRQAAHEGSGDGVPGAIAAEAE